MSAHLVYFCTFVCSKRWPWKAKYFPKEDFWTSYSMGDDGKYHAYDNYDGYESLARLKHDAEMRSLDAELTKRSGGAL